MAHIPVLLDEVVAGLGLREANPAHEPRWIVDGTLGGAGHAEALLEAAGRGGRLLGIDQDPDALDRSRDRLARFGERVVLRQGSFRDLAGVGGRCRVRGRDRARGAAGYRHLVFPDRRAGPGFCDPGGGSARHAHGPGPTADGRRRSSTSGRRTSWPTSFTSMRRSRGHAGSPGRSWPPVRSIPRLNWQRSSPGRWAARTAGRNARGPTRPRRSFRPSASRSTTSWAHWKPCCRRPSNCWRPAAGLP